MNYFRLAILFVFSAIASGCNKESSPESKTGAFTTNNAIAKPADDNGVINHINQASDGKTAATIEPRSTLSDKQKQAATDAIKALGRVEAAIEVGVTYQRYGELVGNAKAEVNEASQILPKGEMLDQLSAIIDAYRDAGMVWNHKLQYSVLGLRGFWDPDILTRYNIEVTIKSSEADADSAMQLIWRVASEKLKNVRNLK